MSRSFTKFPVWAGKYLNDVNDSQQGGVITTVPTGVTASQGEQTIVGDIIRLDADMALALSDTTVGTLHGGLYMYVKTKANSTAAPAVGKIAFWDDASTENLYVVTPDGMPSTAVPTHIAGIYINAISKTASTGNFGWIQIQGLASVLFDNALTATADGVWVTAKVSAGVAATADAGAVAGVVTLAAAIGVAKSLPAVNVISLVQMTRGFGRL